ncbi:hypothetical protein [Formosa sp. PL04]|uniref:hypothetical protein n=1 Tax=Formosa sp. PL04 TaxID=3081755 RepID=UPI002980A59C|nr:hypothetical protein [Formosa sp. PL04]MDW5288615.1 hypothetical protein [Formosa sp. PL04]
MKLSIVILSFVSLIIFQTPELKITKTNLEKSGLAPALYKDGIIFSAFESDNSNYVSLYYSKILDKEQLDKPVLISLKNRDKYMNLSHLTYIAASDEIYFTANNSKGALVLYQAKMEDMEIIKPKQVKLSEINNAAYPTVSENGLQLIVSSKTSDNNVNLFLYTRSDIESNWEFKRALSELNSTDYELHPRLMNDTTLYFSRSNTQTGKLKLFVSNLNDNVWSNPILYQPLNGEASDFSIVFTTEKSGYFTSNRDGEDHIYYFENEL